MLPVAVARFSFDGNAVCYVLPVLWVTSFFTKWRRTDQNRKTLDSINLGQIGGSERESTGISANFRACLKSDRRGIWTKQHDFKSQLLTE